MNGPELSSLTYGNERPSTTTISTIAVQSGKARIVIALLHAGSKISFKVYNSIISMLIFSKNVLLLDVRT